VFISHRRSFFPSGHATTMPDGNTSCNSAAWNPFAASHARVVRSVYATDVLG
jgi:hypothetical protein